MSKSSLFYLTIVYGKKTLMALSSSQKSILVKAGNQFNRYVSNFTPNQKMQDKK